MSSNKPVGTYNPETNALRAPEVNSNADFKEGCNLSAQSAGVGVSFPYEDIPPHVDGQPNTNWTLLQQSFLNPFDPSYGTEVPPAPRTPQRTTPIGVSGWVDRSTPEKQDDPRSGGEPGTGMPPNEDINSNFAVVGNPNYVPTPVNQLSARPAPFILTDNMQLNTLAAGWTPGDFPVYPTSTSVIGGAIKLNEYDYDFIESSTPGTVGYVKLFGAVPGALYLYTFDVTVLEGPDQPEMGIRAYEGETTKIQTTGPVSVIVRAGEVEDFSPITWGNYGLTKRGSIRNLRCWQLTEATTPPAPKYFNFNGTDQYAVIDTDWVPTGSSFKVSFKFIPGVNPDLEAAFILAQDANNAFICGKLASGIPVVGRFTNSTSAATTFTSPVTFVEGVLFDYLMSCAPNANSLTVNGITSVANTVTPLVPQQGIGRIGGYSVYLYAGYVWDILLEDITTPSNSRYYPMTDGSGDVFRCYEADKITAKPEGDATITNYTDNWVSSDTIKPRFRFNGVDQRADVPAWTTVSGKYRLSFKFIVNAVDGVAQYLVTGNGNTPGIVLAVTSNIITGRFNNTDVATPALGATVAIPGTVYQMVLNIAAGDNYMTTTGIKTPVNTTTPVPKTYNFFSGNGGTTGLDGYIWDVFFEDIDDPTNSRWYPMDEGSGDTFFCYEADKITPKASGDATIFNFTENWQVPSL